VPDDVALLVEIALVQRQEACEVRAQPPWPKPGVRRATSFRSVTRVAGVAPLRVFPVVYSATDVSRSADFWERLGFERFFELASDTEPGYIGLRRGTSEIAVVAWDWPAQRYGLKSPAGPRFEMYVYVDDLDALVTDLRNGGIAVLADVADMPWGERVATVVDPDGNPVTLLPSPRRLTSSWRNKQPDSHL
jgi:lactoylglutathione lyase